MVSQFQPAVRQKSFNWHLKKKPAVHFWDRTTQTQPDFDMADEFPLSGENMNIGNAERP